MDTALQPNKRKATPKLAAHLARARERRATLLKEGKIKVGRHKSLTTLRREMDKDAREKFLAFASTQVLPVGDALVEKAKEGDVQAIKEFFDRIWGKAPQQVEHTGEVHFTLRAVHQQINLPVQGEVIKIIEPPREE